MGTRSLKRTFVLTVSLSVTLAACGTRLPESVQIELMAGGGQAVVTDGAAVPDQSPVAAPTATATETDAAVVAGPQPSGQPATAPGSDAAAGTDAPAAEADTPGASAPSAATVDYTKPATGEPVQVGYMFIADLDGFAETFGATNPLGDQKAMFNVVADYMNAHGGLGGRPVELVPYGAEVAGSKSYAQSEGEACQHWIEDNDVVAVVVAEIGTSANLVKCLNDAEVMFVTVQGCCKTNSLFQRYAYHTTPAELGADVLARHLVRIAVERGLVKANNTPADAIGVLGYDHTENVAAIDAFEAEAEAFGLTPVAYAVHSPESTPDIARSAGELPSAVLAMKTANAKAVASLCTNCMNLYMGQAEQQDYYPKYVLSSFDNPFGLSDGRDPKFLDGAVVVGWNPNADVDLYNNPEIWTNPTYELCRQIESPNGINDLANLKVTQSICGAVLLIHESAKAYGGTDITGATLIEGKNRIGTRWPSTTAFTNTFSASFGGSASQYRTMSYDRADGHFVYDGTTLHPFD